MHSCSGLSIIRLAALVLAGGLSIGCASGDASDPSTARSADVRVCTLYRGEGAFVCDMEFSGANCSSPGLEVRSRFLQRMTGVSLELLYLESEPGAVPPYRYRNARAVLERVQVDSCQTYNSGCSCRMTYQDPALLPVIYDSAGCRRNSEHSDNALYFRGRGCRY